MSAWRSLLWWSEGRRKQLLRPSHTWWHCVQPTLGQSLGEWDARTVVAWGRRQEKGTCGKINFQKASLSRSTRSVTSLYPGQQSNERIRKKASTHTHTPPHYIALAIDSKVRIGRAQGPTQGALILQKTHANEARDASLARSDPKPLRPVRWPYGSGQNFAPFVSAATERRGFK